MKPEPLKGKYEEYAQGLWWDIQSKERLTTRESEILEDIKEACEFYLKYKDNPKLLVKDYPEYKEKVNQFIKGLMITPIALIKYNEWLFKLVFYDVLKEDN